MAFAATWLGGCDGCAESTASSIRTSTTVTVAGTEVNVETSTSESETRTLVLEEIPAAFRDLATSMLGTPVFAVPSLPEGIVVADSWWPVIEADSAEDGGRSDVNPRVEGESGQEPEGQLVLTHGGGWLVVIENFRGDLGEASGELVGTVAGQSAHLYEVNGGWLVQWAFESRWYGVFGRDVDPETVTRLALDMALLEVD